MGQTGIDDLTKYIMAKSDRELDEYMVRNVTHWFWAIMTNRTRWVIEYNDDIIPNYFGISLAPSNSGKSWIYKQIIKLMNIKEYEHKMRSSWKYHSTIEGKLITVSREKDIKTLVPFDSASTTQAIQKVGEAFGTCCAGSVNFINEEMFATASDAILDKLYMAYDGIYQASVIKGDDENLSYEDHTDVPTNLLGMTALAVVLDDKMKMKHFISKLKQGLFRRSFVTMKMNSKTKIKKPQKYELSEKTKNLINSAPKQERMTLSKEADDLFFSILKESVEGTSGGEYADLRDPYKILKLAGIRAYSDARNIITKDDIKYAKWFEEITFNMAVEFTELKNTFAHAYRVMSIEPVTLMSLKRYSVVDD